ncbi:MAG: hypothetical protein CL526_12305 [Aequorivita sp.]|nr:hypothetical protein [Aequorivita sp.]|tara:strand:- start:68068 stop:68454 length:387 start_codon:yes stop_codon:yes gene_type:complete
MKNEYDIKLQQEAERILNEVYYNPLQLGDTKIKRAIVKTELRYLEYLVKYNLISRLNTAVSGGRWSIQLESNGYEVFEKYGGWTNYKRKVIDRVSKTEKAKELAVRYWWVPIAVSIVSLIVSAIALLK